MYFIEPFPFKRNMLLNQSSDLGSGDALYSSATIYGLNARVSDSIFGFSYQSLKNNNLGNPLTDALSWTRVAAANVLRAFDVKFALRATAPGSIYYKLNPRVDGFNYDSLSLHDLVAITVTVKYYNTFNALLKTWTINLENPSPDTGYPFNGGNTTDVFITDIPRGTNGYLEIWIDNSLNTIFDAGVGGILFGNKRYIGKACYGNRLSVSSYSTINVDNNGSGFFSPGQKKRKASIPIEIKKSEFDLVFQRLSRNSGNLCGFYMDEATDLKSFNMLAFFRELTIEREALDVFRCTLDLESIS